MKYLTAVFLTLLAARSAAAAPLLEAIWLAHGGRGGLAGLHAYQARFDVTRMHVHESPEPGPPWSTSSGLLCLGQDLSDGRLAGYRRMTGAGFRPRHEAWLAGRAGAWRADLYDGWLWKGAGSPGDLPAPELERLTPPLILRQLLDAGGRLADLGTVRDEDESLHRFRYPAPDGEPVMLDFNAETHLLRRWRRGSLAIAYDEYQAEQGLALSHRMTVSRDGEPVESFSLRAARVNQPIAPDLDPPASLELAAPSTANGATGMQVRELDDGIYQVGEGRRYQVFVVFHDFVVSLGGLGGVAPRLAALESRVGKKPLRYALITHHHEKHLEGVPALVNAGAVLVASPAHERRIRAAAGPGREPPFAFIDGKSEITDGERDLVFLDLGPTRHSRHLLGAYLPREQLLFTADLLEADPGGPVPAGDALMRDLYRALERRGLNVQRFGGTHVPGTMTLARLKSALAREGRLDGFSEWRSALCPP